METLRSNARTGVDRASESRSLTYLSSLDGLRAVAVLAVVAYHAEPDLVPGGFLGVDVFFVISGFLITSLLLGEKRRDRRIDLRRFWRRRARRLGPALLSVLTAVAVAGWLWTPSNQLTRLRGDGIASLAYVMNWRLIGEGDSYFDTFADPSPLRHLWSLSIEEQFYLGWPLLVTVVLARRRRLLGPVALMIGMASVAAMALTGGDLSRLYYGTDTRLHVIMTGCLLAVLADRRPTLVRALALSPTITLATTGGLVAAMLVVTDDDASFYPGGLVLFAAASAVVIAGCARYGTLPVLSSRALVEIGKRSYGLYLWHWPVEVFLTDERLGTGHVPATLIRLAVTLSLTWSSYRLIEQPVRRSHAPLPRWWPALPLGVAALFVLVSLGATTSEFEAAKPPEVRTVDAAPTVEAPQLDGGGRIESVAIVGDSVATSMEDGLAAAFAADGITATVLTHPGCGVTAGIAVAEDGSTPGFAEACPAQLARQDEVIAAVDPDLVLVVAQADSFRRRLPDGTVIVPEDDPDRFLELLRDAAGRLGRQGAIVAFSLPAEVDVAEPGPTNDRIAVYRDLLRRLAAEDPDVVVVPEDQIVCPGGSCRNQLEGTELRPDGIHYDDVSEQLIGPLLVDATLAALRR